MLEIRTRFMVLLVMMLLTFSGIMSDAGGLTKAGDLQEEGYSNRFFVRTLWGDHHIEGLMEEIPSVEADMNSEIYLVQFSGPILKEWKDELLKSDVMVLEYVPDMCYLVRSSEMNEKELKHFTGVTGVSHLPSGLKMTPEVFRLLMEDPSTPFIHHTNQLTIDLLYEEPSVEDRLRSISDRVEKGSTTRYIISLPISSPEELIGIQAVHWIEPKLEFYLNNNVSTAYTGVKEAWSNLGLNGSGQIVAIADTGIDTGMDNHLVTGDILADIDNRVTVSTWAGPNSNDTHSHGTHVTGSVAGNGSLSNGEITGMAPEAWIFFQSIANQTMGNRLETPSNLSLLFQDAYDFGARIHTNSWGAAYAGAYTTSSRDLDWFLYHYPDMIILFSAGNNGRDYYNSTGVYNPDGKIDPDSIGAPASAKNCITVGAGENLRTEGGYQYQWAIGGWASRYSADPIKTDKMSDDPTGMAAFSSRGPTNDGRIQPDVFAPGTNILSLRSTVTSGTGWGLYQHNSNYLFMGGTSMSTPITAGSVVLVREFYNKTLNYTDPSGALLKATLINGAVDMTPGQYGDQDPVTQEITGRPDMTQGWGRINIHDSMVPRINSKISYYDDKIGIDTNDAVTRFVNVNDDDELRLTMAWADYPGVAWGAVNIVNDLDITVTAPNGTQYFGNDFTAPYNDSRDRINPVEGISIRSPAKGWWKVEIKAYNVPMGPQHFALASNYELVNTADGPDIAAHRRYVSTMNDNVTVSAFIPALVAQQSFNVQITSNSDAIGKTITLYKVGIHGQFTGSFNTSHISTSVPGILYVAHDDTINISFTYSTYNIFIHITAKDPTGITVDQKDVYELIHSFNETIHLEASTEAGVETFWRFNGLSMDWMPFYDDGLSEHGDETPYDGNVSAFWSVQNGTFGVHMLETWVKDPFLGDLFYDQFNVTFNTSVPRFPKNLSAATLEIGNTVKIQWDPTDETDISHYSVYTNTTPSVVSRAFNGWNLLSNTTNSATNHTIMGLVDGIDYWLRIMSVDINGNESSLSLPINVTPMDTEPPIITLLTTPYTIVGIGQFQFTGSPDLQMVEMEYYNDSNSNGLEDDGNWTNISLGYTGNYTWDTRNESGGPGNMDAMFLRYRGLDEVPNYSDWVTAYGFRIDNIGPSSVEILAPPPRVTNIGYHSLNGRSEEFGWVEIWQNGIMDSNNTCDDFGGFSFDLDLFEGANNITLASYDQYGAGPTLRTYWFTLDTMLPVPMLDVENQTYVEREIMHEPYIFNSTSFDQGLDDNFTFIENITWTYRGPDSIAKVYYENDFFSLAFTELGIHELTLSVRDPAGNSDEMTLQIMVYDNTSPSFSLIGDLEVPEKTTITYELNWSDNDPRAHHRENFSISWSFTGPNDFIQNHTTEIVRIVFPESGTFQLEIEITDGGNNTANLTVDIEVQDITPPTGNILGAADVILGIPETYTANLTDNGRPMGAGSSYEWSLQYLEGPPDGWWTQNFTGISFEFNFTQTGAYTLILDAADPSGNEKVIQININADGDLTPPHVAEILPAPNASYQFSENVHFIIRFSERMNHSSITTYSIFIRSPNGSKVESSYDIKNKEGRTIVTITPETLEFHTVYTVMVNASVKDSWENRMGEDFSSNYTVRTQFKLVHPWGPSHSDFFSNITNDTVITLRFSNPVTASSIQNYISIRALGTQRDPTSGLTIQTRTPVPFNVEQGEDEYTIKITAIMDEGITYNFTLTDNAIDIYSYELDQIYMWDFTTYLPPVTVEPVDDDTEQDEGPLPEWMEDPLLWIIAAIIVIILFFILVVFAAIRRRRNLQKIWKAEEGRAPIKRTREEAPEPIEAVPSEPIEEEITPPTLSYEDLYGAQVPPPTQGDSNKYGEDLGTIQEPFDEEPVTSKEKEIEWDEDDEPEQWGNEEEEEEEWEEDDDEVEW